MTDDYWSHSPAILSDLKRYDMSDPIRYFRLQARLAQGRENYSSYVKHCGQKDADDSLRRRIGEWWEELKNEDEAPRKQLVSDLISRIETLWSMTLRASLENGGRDCLSTKDVRVWDVPDAGWRERYSANKSVSVVFRIAHGGTNPAPSGRCWIEHGEIENRLLGAKVKCTKTPIDRAQLDKLTLCGLLAVEEVILAAWSRLRE